MINSGFIPEVVDASAINSQINSMQSSVNSISNQNVSIQNRLTQLEKDISADVLKATEVLASTQNSSNSLTVSLSKDLNSYKKVILVIPSFYVVGYQGNDTVTIDAQNISIVKGNSAGITFGVVMSNNFSTLYIGNANQNRNYGIGKATASVTYTSAKTLYFYISATSQYFSIKENMITVQYY